MTDTKQPELSLERFEVLVEAYGGDIERFPEHDRAPAKALVLRSREARRMLAAAHALDVLLADTRERAAPVELRTALSRIPELHAQLSPRVTLFPFRSTRRAGLAAAAVLLLGFFSGQLAEPGAGDGSLQAGLAGESAELTNLTFADELLDDLTVQEGSAE